MAELTRLGGGLTAVTKVEPKPRHGRKEPRMLWALCDPALNARAGEAGSHGLPWPHLAQVCRRRRRRICLGTGEIEDEVSSAVPSLSPAQADAARLLHLVRGHWGIENKLPWVRDETMGEDRCTIRSGAAPEAVAAGRNLVIAWRRRTGEANIAAALRTNAGRWRAAIALVASAGAQVMK